MKAKNIVIKIMIKVFFFIQVDGEAGEKEINEMNKHIDKYKNRIFVGNTEDVINWVNSLIT